MFAAVTYALKSMWQTVIQNYAPRYLICTRTGCYTALIMNEARQVTSLTIIIITNNLTSIVVPHLQLQDIGYCRIAHFNERNTMLTISK